MLKRDAYGAAKGAILLGGAGGIPPFEYRLNDGAFVETQVFRELAAGVYRAEVRDGNGCAVRRVVAIR